MGVRRPVMRSLIVLALVVAVVPAYANPDCAVFVTPADWKAACKAVVEIKPSKHVEGKGAPFTCVRSVTFGKKRAPEAHVQLGSFKSEKEARGAASLEKGKTTAVSGIGDEAWSREHQVLGTREYSVGARRGTYLVRVQQTKHESVAAPPCTMAQLTDLLRVLVGRLP